MCVKKIESFDGPIIFTRDTHGIDYLEHQEGKMLPVPHCVKNTEGWHIVKGLIEAAEGRPIMSPVSLSISQISDPLNYYLVWKA